MRSPWAAFIQILMMIATLSGMLGSAFWFYGKFSAVAEITDANKERSKSNASNIRVIKQMQNTFEERIQNNKALIKRNREDAASDREDIIDRLKGIDDSVNDIKQHLRAPRDSEWRRFPPSIRTEVARYAWLSRLN